MKMKYIKPVILYCYDIDMSIIAATLTDTSTDKTGDSGVITDTPKPGGSTAPGSTKGTSWNLWEDEGDEEENSFY